MLGEMASVYGILATPPSPLKRRGEPGATMFTQHIQPEFIDTRVLIPDPGYRDYRTVWVDGGECDPVGGDSACLVWFAEGVIELQG